MAIKGPMSNLPLVKRNAFRPIIRAVTWAAGLGRLVVRGSGWDGGNRIRGEDGVQPLSPVVTCERCRLYPAPARCHDNWRYQPLHSALCFLICLKFCIIWSLFHSVIFSDATAPPGKEKWASEQITQRWWITISPVLSRFYRHFKVRNSALISMLCSVGFPMLRLPLSVQIRAERIPRVAQSEKKIPDANFESKLLFNLHRHLRSGAYQTGDDRW